MSKRFDVFNALVALLSGTFPGAEVKGLEANAPFPDRIPANGLIIVRNTDPGEPEIDLSPLTYHYEHPFSVELAFLKSPTETAAQVLDRALMEVGDAIEQARTLGDLCAWLDADAPEIVDIIAEGTRAAAGAVVPIIAHYATSNPLK